MKITDLIIKNYYEVKTRCKNCSYRQMTKIKKGNLPEEVIDRGVCKNCGCFQLEVDYK